MNRDRSGEHDPGHPFDWGDFVTWLTETHGSLAAIADLLARDRGYAEDTETIARALRRLRKKRGGDGGVWGRRALTRFGLSSAVESRLRFFAHYHSRFTDLPVPLADDLLRFWDRPPIANTNARVFLLLGRATTTLRRGEDPRDLLDQITRVTSCPPEAIAEHALIEAYVVSRSDEDATARWLDKAADAIQATSPSPDRDCLHARLIDQRAYPLNRVARDHEGAKKLYEEIPDDAAPFALTRKHNGLGWTLYKLGEREHAEEHARRSLAIAGDAGSRRLRAMALRLLARVTKDDRYLKRAQAIANALEDTALARQLSSRS